MRIDIIRHLKSSSQGISGPLDDISMTIIYSATSWHLELLLDDLFLVLDWDLLPSLLIMT